MTPLLQVALGGALGATARYLTGNAMARLLGKDFPWGTLTVNFLGSFLMGVVVVVLAHENGNKFAPLLMTGMLGGFTTYSAFSLDAMTIFERGEYGLASVYVIGTLILALGGIALGLYSARSFYA
ncbi:MULTISPECIES: fluoride efflux transporter CrcB [Celeribacter]|jgi:CrcB protein|uniref:Fluoride-specific ion channel FluC n=1 Tax=Celeribacter halophilus TaxID=576117 RepID=A0AAW7XTE6_9RHOB|nr:fluoride efflux transporter CrcB [Celeribacter halophilus]MBU2888266.1 fluoride efflux transporter CrcB [Celeribacter halophilus]MDO6456529.1 fluoride efflux transporter CrcB [Celeribacter halophilus]MDO6512261.1 fluoride efflux transporter CrcB [Celeribacter halophilus]MDO6722992.1 fluoride efflux transporter CrcB [Celeribacter halophilus]